MNKKLSDYCINITDGEHGSVEDAPNGEYYLLSNKNIINGEVIITPSDRKISEDSYKKINKRTKLEELDVLISTVGTLGKLAIVAEKPNYEFQRSVGIIKCDKNKLLPQYLYYYLSLNSLQNRLINNSKGAVQKCIFINDLKELLVDIPSVSLQKLQINLLSYIDKKIKLNNIINLELEKIAKTLYDYWFVQFDFPDENKRPYKSSGGTMVYNEILKREIPIGWEVIALSDIANITMGQSPSGSSYNTTGQGMPFHQGCANFGDKFPIAEQYTTEPSRMANVGDFLVSVRAPVGSLNIAIEKCCIGRGLAAINSKTNDNEYLYQILQNFKNQFELRNSIGTTFGSITKDDLFSLLVIKPKENVLESYKQICQSLSQEQYNLFLENYKLTKIRDYLLPMLMNGQVSIIT